MIAIRLVTPWALQASRARDPWVPMGSWVLGGSLAWALGSLHSILIVGALKGDLTDHLSDDRRVGADGLHIWKQFLLVKTPGCTHHKIGVSAQVRSYFAFDGAMPQDHVAGDAAVDHAALDHGVRQVQAAARHSSCL